MRRFLILFVLAFLCFSSNAQKASDYEVFVKKNFPEFVKHFKDFDFKNFTLEDTQQLDLTKNGEVFKPKEWSDFLKSDSEFFIYNASKKYAVNFNTYGDIDQAVLLIDVNKRQYHKLTFCGTPCRFEEAKWVNNKVLVLVGSYEDNDKYDEVNQQSKYFGMLLIVDLEKNTKTTYLNQVNESLTFFTGKLFKDKNWD